MRKRDIDSTRGSTYARLKNQTQRHFRSTVEFSHRDEAVERFIASRIADRGEFWWDPWRPDEPGLFGSTLDRGETFFHEIVRHPAPLDMNTLKALKRSPGGLAARSGAERSSVG